MATRKVEERTCDLCGATAHCEPGRQMLGWTVAYASAGDAPEAGGTALVAPRDLCPFCLESIAAVVAGKGSKKDGAK